MSGPCWSCGTEPDDDDTYCSNCGVSLTGNWYHSWWGILILTVFVLGPFSLVLVYRSPKLSRTGKYIMSGVIALVSLYIVYELYAAYMTALEMVNRIRAIRY